jgi:hypothetical protein
VSFCDRQRNMDPLVHARDQGIDETVDFTRQTCSEEGKDCPIGWKGDGHCFLEFTRCDLPKEGQNCHRALLCQIIRLIRRRIAEKRPYLVKKKVHFHHDNAPAHSFAVATAELVKLHYKLLPHPPYQIWPHVTFFCFQT